MSGSTKAITSITTSKFSDNNKAILLISIFVLLLLAFAVGLAALVKVIMLEHTYLRCEKARKEFSEKVEEFGEKFEEFAMNTTEYIEESKEADKDLLEKSKSLFRAAGIIEHVESGMRWSDANLFCTTQRLNLCSYDNLFIEPGMFYKAPYSGIEWVPISDKNNDWAQVGNGLDSKKTYQEENGQAPQWGESRNTETLKKRIFCCIAF